VERFWVSGGLSVKSTENLLKLKKIFEIVIEETGYKNELILALIWGWINLNYQKVNRIMERIKEIL